jgi:hypothetical protein
MSKTKTINTAPSHTARAGMVRACVWESQSEAGESRFKITISRLFRRGESWERGHTFYGDQLPGVVQAVGEAQGWIERRRREITDSPTLAGKSPA